MNLFFLLCLSIIGVSMLNGLISFFLMFAMGNDTEFSGPQYYIREKQLSKSLKASCLIILVSVAVLAIGCILDCALRIKL